MTANYELQTVNWKQVMSTTAEQEEKQITGSESSEEQLRIPDMLPVLPLRDIVIFPFMIVPLFVSRDRSIQAVDQALAEKLIYRALQECSKYAAEKERRSWIKLYQTLHDENSPSRGAQTAFYNNGIGERERSPH